MPPNSRSSLFGSRYMAPPLGLCGRLYSSLPTSFPHTSLQHTESDAHKDARTCTKIQTHANTPTKHNAHYICLCSRPCLFGSRYMVPLLGLCSLFGRQTFHQEITMSSGSKSELPMIHWSVTYTLLYYFPQNSQNIHGLCCLGVDTVNYIVMIQ